MYREIDPEQLAKLPMAYLAEQQDLFERCRTEGGVDEAYREIFTVGVWAYQLYSYLDLVVDAFGNPLGRAVRHRLMDRLEQESGARSLMESAFEIIDSVRSAGGRTKSRDVPLEMNIALAMLLRMPASPDYSGGRQHDSARIGDMELDTDWYFSDCLSRGQVRIRCLFDLMLARPPDEERA